MKENKAVLLLLIFISIISAGSYYVITEFSLTNFEQVIFILKQGNNGADTTIFLVALIKILKLAIMIFILLYILIYDITFGRKVIRIKNQFQIYPIRIINKYKKQLALFLLIISIILLSCSIGIPKYIIYLNKESTFIEKNYKDSKDVNITFDKKKNLIFIMVESLETSFYTKEEGGYWDYELIPELYNLQNEKDSISFYNKNKEQQTNMIKGSSWTTSSIVSSLSGIPLKPNIKNKVYDENGFLNNIYSLGDVLKDNGYHNELISSARVSFGGIKEYFENHGNYEIIDETNLNKYNFYPKKEDYGKWGMNDNYLFKISKERLKKISKEQKPFNLQLITIDTHFVDGYVGKYSVKKYKNQYENAYATESKLVYDFVNWVKSQEFYKNTTIVILGDHLSMQSNIFKEKNVKSRYMFNCIINSDVKDENSSKRISTPLDYYPTIIRAIGGNIEKERLGLGVNLFSKEKTLSEKYGFKYVTQELDKNSHFYNDKILNTKKANK